MEKVLGPKEVVDLCIKHSAIVVSLCVSGFSDAGVAKRGVQRRERFGEGREGQQGGQNHRILWRLKLPFHPKRFNR